MNLEDFVANSLQQIILGIQRAQASIKAQGVQINPQVEGRPNTDIDVWSGTLLRDIEFDVAVTVSESGTSGADLSVGLPWVKAGLRGGSEHLNSAVSRVKFSIPVALPKHPYAAPD